MKLVEAKGCAPQPCRYHREDLPRPPRRWDSSRAPSPELLLEWPILLQFSITSLIKDVTSSSSVTARGLSCWPLAAHGASSGTVHAALACTAMSIAVFWTYICLNSQRVGNEETFWFRVCTGFGWDRVNSFQPVWGCVSGLCWKE